MSTLLQNHISLLDVINRATNERRTFLIEHLTNNAVKVFGEMALNIMKGVVPLNNREKLQLFSFKHDLVRLMRVRLPIKEKRKIILGNPKLPKLLISPTIRYFTSTDI